MPSASGFEVAARRILELQAQIRDARGVELPELDLGGGFGIALSFARWAVRRLCGATVAAPISGQRALRAETLHACLPLAKGFGMEIGMTVDAVRAAAAALAQLSGMQQHGVG